MDLISFVVYLLYELQTLAFELQVLGFVDELLLVWLEDCSLCDYLLLQFFITLQFVLQIVERGPSMRP